MQIQTRPIDFQLSAQRALGRLSRGAIRIALLLIPVALAAACRDSTGPDGQQSQPPDETSVSFIAVGVGDNTTCALDQAGRAYCWGYNYGGALGTGDAAYRLLTPRAVSNAPAPFAAISVGAGHQCALTGNLEAYCWGNNGAGQLGSGGQAQSQGVTAVAGGHAFVSISAGGDHTCALASDQAAYCWGDNGYGQLGAGAGVSCDYTNLPCHVPAPVRVSGTLHFVQISTGRDHTCGVTNDGTGYCWGDNESGQLGDPAIPIQCGAFPTHSLCIRNAPIAVAGGLRFAQISAGAFHTCGVTTTSKAYCWGLVTADAAIRASGLGNAAFSGEGGTQRGSRSPVPAGEGFQFREVRAGNGVSCGLTDNGAAVCWGRNNYGQMGVGGIDPFFTTSPLSVHMPTAQTAPSVGEDYHACALAPTGRIWCWGGVNFYGELGSEPVGQPGVSPELRGVPTPVTPPSLPH